MYCNSIIKTLNHTKWFSFCVVCCIFTAIKLITPLTSAARIYERICAFCRSHHTVCTIDSPDYELWPSLYCPYKEYYVIRIITLNRRFLYLRLEKANTSTIDANIYLNCCFLAKYLTKIRIPFALLHLLLFNSLCWLKRSPKSF